MKEIKQNARKASGLLKSLSNPNRLLVLCALVEGKKTVSEMLKIVDISQSALSQHLARMRHEGIVDFERKQRSIFYFIKDNNVKKIINTLHNIYC